MKTVIGNVIYVLGGRITLACRDMKQCEKVRQDIVKESFNNSVKCQELDLASCASIRNFAKKVNEGLYIPQRPND